MADLKEVRSSNRTAEGGRLGKSIILGTYIVFVSQTQISSILFLWLTLL